ncbi:3'-5' exonuclease [Aneurinibacillus soli]|uniref:Exonuclease n=1 Tax=Aneurinibacillus soli TaxID=1500254 RepID=A0A0U4WI75_9BACL|nr:3'-5' exonuclease [Aneurinibacillus soli]BAU28297.1 exonuclease [Aneurinibacillus soli]
MNYIVMDTEINGRVWKSPNPMEIISIGAVKITEEDIKNKTYTCERFYEYIKPVYTYTDYARKFTKIPRQTIAKAESLVRVVEKFKRWIGEEEYVFIGWSDSDKLALLRDCKMHKMDGEWIDPYIDLQAYIKRYVPESNQQQLSLKNAVEVFGLHWIGEEHDALDDAMNTAKIFTLLCEDKTGNIIQEFMRGSSCKVYRKCKRCGTFYYPKSNRLKRAKVCKQCFTEAQRVRIE